MSDVNLRNSNSHASLSQEAIDNFLGSRKTYFPKRISLWIIRSSSDAVSVGFRSSRMNHVIKAGSRDYQVSDKKLEAKCGYCQLVMPKHYSKSDCQNMRVTYRYVSTANPMTSSRAHNVKLHWIRPYVSIANHKFNDEVKSVAIYLKQTSSDTSIDTSNKSSLFKPINASTPPDHILNHKSMSDDELNSTLDSDFNSYEADAEQDAEKDIDSIDPNSNSIDNDNSKPFTVNQFQKFADYSRKTHASWLRKYLPKDCRYYAVPFDIPDEFGFTVLVYTPGLKRLSQRIFCPVPDYRFNIFTYTHDLGNAFYVIRQSIAGDTKTKDSDLCLKYLARNIKRMDDTLESRANQISLQAFKSKFNSNQSKKDIINRASQQISNRIINVLEKQMHRQFSHWLNKAKQREQSNRN